MVRYVKKVKPNALPDISINLNNDDQDYDEGI